MASKAFFEDLSLNVSSRYHTILNDESQVLCTLASRKKTKRTTLRNRHLTNEDGFCRNESSLGALFTLLQTRYTESATKFTPARVELMHKALLGINSQQNRSYAVSWMTAEAFGEVSTHATKALSIRLPICTACSHILLLQLQMRAQQTKSQVDCHDQPRQSRPYPAGHRSPRRPTFQESPSGSPLVTSWQAVADALRDFHRSRVIQEGKPDAGDLPRLKTPSNISSPKSNVVGEVNNPNIMAPGDFKKFESFSG